MYGKELIIDLHSCNAKVFTRTGITEFMEELCELIDMERCDLHFWDYAGYPEDYDKAADHLKGISAVQFITTSNITIHTLDVFKTAHINIFSCKEFSIDHATKFTCNFFGGCLTRAEVIKRG